MKTIDVKTVKANKKTTKKVVKVSEYQTKVLGINSKLKVERKSLGGCIKTLLMFNKEIGLSNVQTKTLKFIQSDNEAYKTFKSTVRTSKSPKTGNDLGTYSPFYVLQALYKAEKMNAKK